MLPKAGWQAVLALCVEALEAVERGNMMKWFIDGDQVCITKDDFVNLAESPAVFTHEDSDYGKIIKRDGLLGLPFGDLVFIKHLLKWDGGSI